MRGVFRYGHRHYRGHADDDAQKRQHRPARPALDLAECEFPEDHCLCVCRILFNSALFYGGKATDRQIFVPFSNLRTYIDLLNNNFGQGVLAA